MRPTILQPSEDAGIPKPGMAWIPSGTLRVGTPAGRVPRISDEEMPGTAVEMGGFYIDLLPWPNETNAIPTTNVTRDEAEAMCATKGKRLCSELEWERACKGPENTTYEYGDVYRKDVCGTGVALEQASRRPTGEHASCKSGFGVSEMHGGSWEWTSSAWGRSSRDGSLGVLRGGNSLAGELVGRCANAIARAPSKKAPTMGFRCCLGPKNPAEVQLELAGTAGLFPLGAASARAWSEEVARAAGRTDALPSSLTLRALSWIPTVNDTLVIAIGCVDRKACGLVVARGGGDAGAGQILASVSTGPSVAEVFVNGDSRHLRMKALDAKGAYLRDVSYVYGRVEVSDSKRP